MAIIKLLTPLNPNGTINFNEPDLEKPGLYVVGVRIPVDVPVQFQNNEETNHTEKKFCPLYVGIHQNLIYRINGHRLIGDSSGELNTNKELFDLNIDGDVSRLYKSISRYLMLRKGKAKGNHNPNGETPQITFPKDCHKCKNELSFFSTLRDEENTLIWFPNPAFFNGLLEIPFPDWRSSYLFHDRKGLSSHKKSLEELPNTSELWNKIDATKNIIQNNFWFAYVTLDSIAASIIHENKHLLYNEAMEYIKNKTYTIKGKNGPGKTIIENVENTLRKLLSEIGIHTYAKAGKQVGDYQFDLSAIQNSLVNLTSIPFPNKLIIPFKNA